MAEQKSIFKKLFAEPEDGRVRFPITQIIFGPYMLLINKFKAFAYIGTLYALILSIIYLMGGQSLFCSLGTISAGFCSQSLTLAIVVRIIILALIAVYCVRYYQAVWQNAPLNLAFLFKPQKNDLLSVGAIIAFLLLNGIALLSGYLLYARVPNPDWRIELTYFGIVASGFLVPFVLLRFYLILAYIWGGEKMLSIAYIWKICGGNNLRILCGIALWFFVWVFGISAIASNFAEYARGGSIYAIFFGEYVFNFVMLIMISCFVNFCGIQKFFIERKINEKTENN